MRLTFFSNFLNAHQLGLAQEFAAMPGVEYCFVSLTKREGLVGRESLDYQYPYVLREYEGEVQEAAAMRHALEDDVVVFGAMDGKEQYVRARAETGRLFFRYAERLLKRGDWWRFVPMKRQRTYEMFGRYGNSNMYILCASAFTARDLALFGFPCEKCLKWGYFPQVSIAPSIDSKTVEARMARLPRYCSLSSAQRAIPWKRVDMQVRLASRLKQAGYQFHLTIAGDGPEIGRLTALSRDLDVNECVEFAGQLTPKEVQGIMRESDVFLATSNRKEGWGATINEAMAAGCCVIASDEMGSVPYLIEDGVSGFAFHSGDMEDLTRVIREVLSRPDWTEHVAQIGRSAQKTIAGEWSAQEAARRLYFICNDILEGKSPTIPEHGPVSRA